MKPRSDIVGILPCAGNQTRMKELSFSKELLPLFDGRPVIQHSIDSLRLATSHLVAVVHPDKKDLISYLKKQSIKIIAQQSPGLPHSIALGNQRKSLSTLFALPDTFYQPMNIFQLLSKHPEPNVIGLFESNHPQRFDSVRTYKDRITQYAVKVDPPLSSWTMGCGKLSPSSIKLLRQPTKNNQEIIFGDLIQPLVDQKQLFCVKPENSSFFDLGTPENYIEYLIHRYPPKQ